MYCESVIFPFGLTRPAFVRAVFFIAFVVNFLQVEQEDFMEQYTDAPIFNGICKCELSVDQQVNVCHKFSLPVNCVM